MTQCRGKIWGTKFIDDPINPWRHLEFEYLIYKVSLDPVKYSRKISLWPRWGKLSPYIEKNNYAIPFAEISFWPISEFSHLPLTPAKFPSENFSAPFPHKFWPVSK
jgi:hypothetical protein